MTAQQTERSITTAILRKLNAEPGVYARKTYGSASGGAGWPDIVCVAHGVPIMLEVKRPGKKATMLQQRELARWIDAGAHGFVVDGVGCAVSAVRVASGGRAFAANVQR